MGLEHEDFINPNRDVTDPDLVYYSDDDFTGELTILEGNHDIFELDTVIADSFSDLSMEDMSEYNAEEDDVLDETDYEDEDEDDDSNYSPSFSSSGSDMESDSDVEAEIEIPAELRTMTFKYEEVLVADTVMPPPTPRAKRVQEKTNGEL